MSDQRNLPAPPAVQDQPTRAAAPDSGRSLRDARGSHPTASKTASGRVASTVDKTRKEDARCWYEGFWAGRRGEPMWAKPYSTGTLESWSWAGGHIEGKERREKDKAMLDATREH